MAHDFLELTLAAINGHGFDPETADPMIQFVAEDGRVVTLRLPRGIYGKVQATIEALARRPDLAPPAPGSHSVFRLTRVSEFVVSPAAGEPKVALHLRGTSPARPASGYSLDPDQAEAMADRLRAAAKRARAAENRRH